VAETEVVRVQTRIPCPKCGHNWGTVKDKNGHQTTWCEACGAYIMNVPRSAVGLRQRSVKSTHEAITGATRKEVMLRAAGRCELCGKRGEALQVGHLVSVEAGHRHGLTDEEINHRENLCGLCEECNSNLRADVVPLRVALVMIRDRTR
jgi:5-methylcytosine-specific restriction endonuclease McrA